VDFVDRVHGTGFPEIRPWKPRLAIPVEIVEVLTGTDSCIQVAMQYASAGAAISIQSVGARTGLPSRKEIDYFLATYKG